MKKIRILHLITRLPVGGAERLILGILYNLDSEQFDSVVCCIQDRGELAAEVEAMDVPLISLGLMQHGRHDRTVVPALRQIMQEHHIDLVHSHLYHANLYGRLAAHQEGIPIIASVHNTYKRKKWHRHLINRYLGRHTFMVTAGSTDVEKDLRKVDHLPKHKIALLPNSIDLSRVETTLTVSEAKQQMGFSSSDIIIGTVGRIEEQKGHIFLLEAFSLLKKKPGSENLRLLIVGDGRQLNQLQETAEHLGLMESCQFPGNISHLADVYRAIDVFSMSSLWEGLSLAMLEAMAAGLPIVATDVGGARDVLGDNLWGILVPPQAPEALAQAMSRLLENPDLCAEMATRGSEQVRMHYSITALTAQLSELYQASQEE